MEHKSNEEKANEIARDMLPYNNAEYHACYNSAMKAMEWKEQQMIGELKKWLNENPPIKNTLVCEFYVNSLLKALKGE